MSEGPSLDAALEYLGGINPQCTINDEDVKELSKRLPKEYAPALAQRLGLNEPLRYHQDNCMSDDASMEDVAKCINFFAIIRKGTSPMQVPGFVEFLEKQDKQCQMRVISHGLSLCE